MRIGVDLGGTKIEAIVLDDNGDARVRRRVATPAGDYAGTVRAVAELVEAVAREAGCSASTPVGVGIPGSLSPSTGRVQNANSTVLIGEALDVDLASALGRPVRLANDANCFALSEATDGAGAGAAVVFGVILGTGVGGGIVVDGRVLVGPNAIAGEWGHNPLPWPLAHERPGPRCYCGERGCIETYLSGPGLVADHRRHGGMAADARALALAATEGDAAAAASIARYAERLARALATVINLLDPDVIVLGGGLSHLRLLYELVPSFLPARVFAPSVATVLRPPQHGDSSGVRGAAWLWPGLVSP